MIHVIVKTEQKRTAFSSKIDNYYFNPATEERVENIEELFQNFGITGIWIEAKDPKEHIDCGIITRIADDYVYINGVKVNRSTFLEKYQLPPLH